MKRLLASAVFATALNLTCVGLAFAQEPYLGEIRLFGFNFCPVGWAPANGQTLSISANSALFSLYGTYFGGNGTTNFNLPDLTGRAPVAFGSPPNGQAFGTAYGASSVNLTIGQLPPHTHQLRATSQSNNQNLPAGALLATFPAGEKIYSASTAPADTAMSTAAIGLTGGGLPVSTQSPALAVSWCVATQGIYPSRP